ncbi:MAG: hypothetical protein WAM70_10545, partial [Pyrinomonadaceae bacterium]
ITNYMTTGAFTLLKHAAKNRERWLQRFYEIGKEAVRPRKRGELVGFEFGWDTQPPAADQKAKRLVKILEKAGVEIRTELLSGFYLRQKVFVPLAQPYGAFAKALLQSQRYPDLRDSSGRPIPPYDVTAHNLALLMGIEVAPVYRATRRFAGSRSQIVDDGKERFIEIHDPPLVSIYKSHLAAMDEGWTRWVVEKEGPNYSALYDREILKSDLTHRANARTIIIPDQPPNAILNGHRKGAMPEQYTGGLGEKGVKALREFVEAGGTLVCLNRASSFAIEQFKLPVRDVVAGLPRTDFYVPGSILRIELDTSNPIAEGMPKESIAWVENSPVFEVMAATQRGSSPTVREGVSARVIAWYPRNKDPLLSGWLLGGDRLKGKAALVEVSLGKGRIILFGFRPQYRAQSLATYPLLFNAINP